MLRSILCKSLPCSLAQQQSCRRLLTTSTSLVANRLQLSSRPGRLSSPPLAPAVAQWQQQRRPLSSGDVGASDGTKQEEHIRALLQEKLNPTKLKVQDVSGGCGAMYSVEVESPAFMGMSMVAQHRLVNQVLAKEIAEMHGMSLVTRPSKTTSSSSSSS